MQATRQSKLDSLARRVDQANLYLADHPRAKVATAVKSLQNQITKLKLASWVAYILVRELARRWIDLDLTVEEGINKLATLCVTEIIGDGKVRCGTVPQPRPDVVELLARSGIPMPAVIRSRGVKVATKKKLPPSRANRF
jgi:hypothetical protein